MEGKIVGRFRWQGAQWSSLFARFAEPGLKRSVTILFPNVQQFLLLLSGKRMTMIEQQARLVIGLEAIDREKEGGEWTLVIGSLSVEPVARTGNN